MYYSKTTQINQTCHAFINVFWHIFSYLQSVFQYIGTLSIAKKIGFKTIYIINRTIDI